MDNLITNYAYPGPFNSPNPGHKMPQIEESPHDSHKSKRKQSIDIEEVTAFAGSKIRRKELKKRHQRPMKGADKI